MDENGALVTIRAAIAACPHANAGWGHRAGDDDTPCARVWSCGDCGAWDEEIHAERCVFIAFGGLSVATLDGQGRIETLRTWDGDYRFVYPEEEPDHA